MEERHNKAVSLISLLHGCATLLQWKYTLLIRKRRNLLGWGSPRCRRLFPRSRTLFLQRLEHGLGDYRFTSGNPNRRCRLTSDVVDLDQFIYCDRQLADAHAGGGIGGCRD